MARRYFLLLLSCLCFGRLANGGGDPRSERLLEASQRLEARLANHGRKLPLAAPEILIEKQARKLTLFDGKVRVASYPIALGASPAGPKEHQGDMRTPEGSYYVCTRNPASSFHLFLGLSYPNEHDALRGVRDGLISASRSEQIRQAIRERRRPLWNSKLGGAVGIHGGGSGSDWTWGCVALDNAHIEELWVACPLGTPVRIVP